MPRKPLTDNAIDDSDNERVTPLPTRQIWKYKTFGDHFVVLVDSVGRIIKSTTTIPDFDTALNRYHELEPWSIDPSVAEWIDSNKGWFNIVYRSNTDDS